MVFKMKNFHENIKSPNNFTITRPFKLTCKTAMNCSHKTKVTAPLWQSAALGSKGVNKRQKIKISL